VVAGVSFETSSGLTGLTNASGEFSYQTGDTVSFRLGDVELGSVAASPVLTPVELVGAVSTADRRVINLSRFLQSLDDDADPTNGLSVTESARKELSVSSTTSTCPFPPLRSPQASQFKPPPVEALWMPPLQSIICMELWESEGS
jgi:hypothetical protein